MIVQYMVAKAVNPDSYYQIWGAIWVKIKCFFFVVYSYISSDFINLQHIQLFINIQSI